MQHLRYKIDCADYAGEQRHPQEVLRELGISYALAVPQSMGEQWWLFDCSYETLPSYITPMVADAWMVRQYNLPTKYRNDSLRNNNDR